MVPRQRMSLTASSLASALRWSVWRVSNFVKREAFSSSSWRLASAAAQPRGLAVKLWPWKNVLRGSSLMKPWYRRSLAIVTPMGRNPPVSPLDRAIRSGLSPACSEANRVPVRPNPVITSSAISRLPWLCTRSCTARRKSGRTIRIPDAPWIRGSRITAAVGVPSAASSSCSALASFASTSASPQWVCGQLTRATSKSSSS